jgi:hypothetical protein
MGVLVERKYALPVLLLYLVSTNALKLAYVVLVCCARSTVCAKFTNLTVRAEKERRTFLRHELSYLSNDRLYFSDQWRQEYRYARELSAINYITTIWYRTDRIPSQEGSKRE